VTAGLAVAAAGAHARSWFVFPVGRDLEAGDNKRPLVKWREWSVPSERADELFALWQDKARVTGYGIDCGRSGLVVLDEDATEALAALCAANEWEPLPPTFTVTTGRGRHFYYLAPTDGREVRNHVKADGAEVDIRGAGGYVVGPASLHALGVVYAIEDARDPVPLPEWFVDRFGTAGGSPAPLASVASSTYASETTPRGRATLDEARVLIETAAEGTRNDTLNKQAYIVASQVKGGLIEAGEAEAVLLAAADANGLPEEEVRKTLRSAADAAPPFGPAVWFDAQLDEASGGEGPGDVPSPDAARFAREVETEVRRIAVRDAAADRVRQRRYAEQAAPMPSLLTLDRVLAQPRTAPRFLVDGLWPHDGTTLHIAQRKTGKTALALNLTRSLVDGDPFLGVFACAGGERVALVNLEDPESALADLLDRQGIADPAAVLPVSLNGNARAFDVMTDKGRARWAAALADEGITVLIVDPLKPLVDAFGLDEWRQTGELFNAIKACAHDAGIRHIHVSHHAGHALEGGRVRARGDSSLEGTADALWFSSMDDLTDARSARQFSALGRGVAVDKGALLLDAATGRQTYTSKAAGLVIVKRHAVVEFLTDNGTTSRQGLIDNVTGLDKNNTKAVLEALVASGEVVETVVGSQHAKRYSLPAGPDALFPEDE
jgi:hypothetical protein